MKNFLAPCLAWETAAEMAENWRSEGFIIGFTNGCFDILHAGHVTYLAAAREKCDRLILAINSDDSVKRLKGASRPVNDLVARQTVMAGLKSIDMVVSFGSRPEEADTPLKIIELLKPDRLFKGGDYTKDTVVGAHFVESRGGRAELIPFVDGFSTTNTINQLKGN